MDTYPTIKYLNATSHRIHSLVNGINTEAATEKVAYSNDAGCHVFLFTQKCDVAMLKEKLQTDEMIQDQLEKILETTIDETGVVLI